MTRPSYYLPERLDSFIAELISAYKTTIDAPPLSSPKRNTWTDEELSRIRRELRKLTALRVPNAADAEDIIQDTLLTLIHSCPRECLEKDPIAWSAGVLRNKIGNYYRKGRYRAKRETVETEIRHDRPQSGTTVSPERDLLQEELRNIIAGAVESLPRAQKTAIKMLIAGLKPGEIAAKMSPERYQTVINHLHRGRKKLAQELTRHGFGGMYEMKRSPGEKKRTMDKRDKNEAAESA